MIKLILPLTFLSFLLSCGVQQKESLAESAEKNLRDTITEKDGSIRKSYGETDRLDSVVILTKEHQILGKEYYLANKLIQKSFFDENGHLIEEHDFIAGYEKSTGETRNDYYVIQYNAQRQIVAEGMQGTYNGTGVPVDAWYVYQNGKLVREMYYHNDESGKDYIRYKIYDENGNVSESYSNNFILYETDSLPLSKTEYLLRIKP